jgi:drug/metabolite transporter (DMT)-like permease
MSDDDGDAARSPAAAAGLLAVVALLWGLQWPIIKLGLIEIGPWTYRGIGALLGGVFLAVLASLRGASLRLPLRAVPSVVTVGFFATTLLQIFSGYGVALMPPSRAVILLFTMPLWATVLARPLLGERLTGEKRLALLLGLAGIALLVGPDWATLADAPLGPLFMLAAAAGWAVGNVLIKRLHPPDVPTLTFATWQLILGSLPLALVSFLVEPVGESLAKASATALLSLAYNVCLANSVGIYAWFRLVRIAPLHMATLGTLLVPIVGVASAPLIAGDAVGPRELGALALVVGALAVGARGGPLLARARAFKARRSSR